MSNLYVLSETLYVCLFSVIMLQYFDNHSNATLMLLNALMILLLSLFHLYLFSYEFLRIEINCCLQLIILMWYHLLHCTIDVHFINAHSILFGYKLRDLLVCSIHVLFCICNAD